MNTEPIKRKLTVCIFSLLAWLFLAATPQSWAAGSNSHSTTIITNNKSWSQMTTVEKSQMVCVLSGVMTLFVAEIWFIVAGFKTSVGWGLFMLFIGGMRSIFAALTMIAWIVQWMWLSHTHWNEPVNKPLTTIGLICGTFVAFAGLGAIIFIVRHWDQARKPLAVMTLGILLILAVVALQFAK